MLDRFKLANPDSSLFTRSDFGFGFKGAFNPSRPPKSISDRAKGEGVFKAMAFNDLREGIAALEEERVLSRIRAEVDWDEEIGAITREVGGNRYPTLGTELSPRMKELLQKRWREYGL